MPPLRSTSKMCQHRTRYLGTILLLFIRIYQITSFSLQNLKVPFIRTDSLLSSYKETEDEASKASRANLIRSTMSIRIIYESENILAIDKPPHVSHHDDPEQMGILSCIRALQNENKIDYQGRLWGVHRLDRVTSGILIFAKSNEIAQELAALFREKKVNKYYVALTNKKPKKKKQGWVKGDMKPSRRKTWKLANSMENPAITRFYTAGLGNCDFIESEWLSKCDSIESVTSTDESSVNLMPKTMILFKPHTGKTHQLRVAAKSLGMPILGDLDYSDAAEAKCMNRTYLHALAMSLEVNGEQVAIYNPPKSWFGKVEDSVHLESILSNTLKKHCDCDDLTPLILKKR